MEEIRKAIYTKLKSISTEIKVYKIRPETLENFPCITYYIANNSGIYSLDNIVEEQSITVVVDIWTETSKQGDQILIALESKMREIDYVLEFSSDIPDPDPKNISHITCRFIY